MRVSMTGKTRSINHIFYKNFTMTKFTILINVNTMGVLRFELAHDDDLYVSGYNNCKK